MIKYIKRGKRMSKRRTGNSIRMPLKYDRTIHIWILVLLLFGLVMITSASMGIATTTPALVNVVAKQVVFSIMGLVIMIFAARAFDLKRLMKFLPMIILATFFFLLFALTFPAVGGARAWLRFPLGATEITIQPSEFAKISAILIIAAYFGDVKTKKKTPWQFIKVPTTIILGFVFIILFLQSDLGSAVILLVISVILYLIPQHPQLRQYQTAIITAAMIAIPLVFVVLSPMGPSLIEALPLRTYQKLRILTAINPFVDQYGHGYQLINGLVAFSSGGFFGVGFGNSIRKYTNFPAANTDFILSIIVEELGFLGFFVIALAYGVIIWRLFKYAFKMKNEKGKIILVGTAMYLLIHFLFNVGGVTGLIPMTGIPLLMISYGGSSTMSCMLAIGLSQAVIARFRQGVIE